MTSRRDDAKIAQDERSAVLGNETKMKSSLSFIWFGAPNQMKERETGCGVALTQGSGSACAPLRRTSPWAIFWPPLPGLRRPQPISTRWNWPAQRANRRPGLDAGSPFCLPFNVLGPAPLRPGRSSVSRRSFRLLNPQGWQREAEGRNAEETPGSGVVVPGILGGMPVCDPGGVASAFAEATADKSLNHRLLSGKPPAYFGGGRALGF
jgi:hypothetical protein